MYQAFRRGLSRPLAGMEMRGPGANQCGELLSSMASIVFPGPDLTDHLPLPFLDLLTRPTFPWSLSLIVDQGPQPQELDNLPALLASPRLNGPFCWRGRSPQACAVCARACDAAKFLPAPPSGKPSAR